MNRWLFLSETWILFNLYILFCLIFFLCWICHHILCCPTQIYVFVWISKPKKLYHLVDRWRCTARIYAKLLLKTNRSKFFPTTRYIPAGSTRFSLVLSNCNFVSLCFIVIRAFVQFLFDTFYLFSIINLNGKLSEYVFLSLFITLWF